MIDEGAPRRNTPADERPRLVVLHARGNRPSAPCELEAIEVKRLRHQVLIAGEKQKARLDEQSLGESLHNRPRLFGRGIKGVNALGLGVPHVVKKPFPIREHLRQAMRHAGRVGCGDERRCAAGITHDEEAAVRAGAKTIVPLVPHDPPRPAGASQSTRTMPSARSIRLSFRPAKNAMDLPSGDQNG